MAAALMKRYAGTSFAVAPGNGIWLTDADGRTHLNYIQRIGANTLGHVYPRFLAAVIEQAHQC